MLASISAPEPGMIATRITDCGQSPVGLVKTQPDYRLTSSAQDLFCPEDFVPTHEPIARRRSAEFAKTARYRNKFRNNFGSQTSKTPPLSEKPSIDMS
jgi:hypothetical protein